MALPIYPQDELDNPFELLGLVGNFWSDLFGQTEQVKSLLSARASQDKQISTNFYELLDSISRLKIKPLRKKAWYLLTFDTAQRDKTYLNTPRYSQTTANYGGEIFYNGVQSLSYTTYPLPINLKNVPILVNRISASSYVAVNNMDYTVQDGAILFVTDPALNPNIVLDDGKFTLWVFGSDWDERDLYYQFGYVISQEQASTSNYKQFINANYDSMVRGTASRSLDELLEAFTDVPLVKTTGEIVQQIFDFNLKRWVITDKNVYGYVANSTVLVNVGDVLTQGQSLTDTLRIRDFNRGVVPADIPALALGKNFTMAGLYQELVFENKSLPTAVYTKDDGYTAFEFPVRGNPGDIEAFWAEVHARGVAADKTLAMLLDPRTNKTEQPTALVLPTTINPLEFLIKYILRNNFLLITLKPSKFGPNALNLNVTYALRRLVLPHIGTVVFIALEAETDQINMGIASTTDAGYAAEDVSIYFGNSVAETIDAASLVNDQDVTIRLIQGRCE
jgi:hypothetical protein